MYETLFRLWKEGKLTEDKLVIAVMKGWISEGEKEAIAGEPKQERV